ncbi:MAG: hypothetical protein U0350_10150 [Caldilineaceae bacterium]
MKLPNLSGVKNGQRPMAAIIKQAGLGVNVSQASVYLPALNGRHGQYTGCSCQCNGRAGAIEDGPVCGTITQFS